MPRIRASLSQTDVKFKSNKTYLQVSTALNQTTFRFHKTAYLKFTASATIFRESKRKVMGQEQAAESGPTKHIDSWLAEIVKTNSIAEHGMWLGRLSCWVWVSFI